MIKQNFNDNWFFRHGLDNPMASAFVGVTAQLTPVQLPHDAMLLSGRSAANTDESGIGYFTPENVEYEKTLTLTPEELSGPVYLECEGVYSNAVIEVNGAVAARHRFGFTGFVTRISDFLKPGDNRIRISVLNGVRPNGRYYTGTGIYRDVKLMMGRPLHIAPDGVRLTTLEASSELAVIEAVTRLRFDGPGHGKAVWRLRLIDRNGRTAAEAHTMFNIFSGEETVLRQRLYLRNPQLWSCGEPTLYRWECTIEEYGEENRAAGSSEAAGPAIIDRAEGSFGVRTLSLDPIHGLRLNGEQIRLKGGCIHSDNAFLGAVSVPEAEMRRIRMLREAGYNAVRTAHNPVSHAFLDACDKYGMLVMEEYADAWTHSKPALDYSIWMEDCWEQDIEDMVRVAFNHPSVILYSIGNEITDVGSDLSARWGRRFTEKFKTLDPTRYVTNGLNIMMANLDKIGAIAADMGIDIQSGEINNMMAQIGQLMGALVTHPISLKAMEESCQLLDIVGYNYAAHMYEAEHQTWPDRIFVGTETNPPDLDRNWELVEKHPYVLGDFAWICWDYLGEPGIGRIEERQEGFNVYAPYPWVAAYCADFDLTGYRRPVSYWREIIWGGRSHEPYIAVQRPENLGKDMYYSQWSWTDSVHSWTWPGCEQKPAVVEVYSDAEEVELFLNGTSCGTKSVGTAEHRCYCKWEIIYVPGTLEAVARIGGQEVGRQTLATVNGAVLTLHTEEPDSRQEDGSRIRFVEIEYRDAAGTLDLAAQHTLTLQAEDGLEILGSGSANPITEESFLRNIHQTFEGRALAIVRMPADGGGRLIVTDELGNSAEMW